MTVVRCADCTFDNTRMRTAGYEIIAIETHAWNDGVTETEILWGRDDTAITEADLPY
ncbi:conserved protein of unknown function (plasmid) [Rhodovastum atsumiense]|uniref:hypothetical protein n=1 Tax=Rhodovastum atsumiense TaxID=504468 RepID=UPI00139F2AA9|nr:hypothetical protein [Rhodovastum atsumiense]CAH2605959.1 conserved protein of unknown function [Rhodovastum atsumiense]